MQKLKDIKRFLFDVYAFSFLNKFLLLTPVYTIFMQENGMNGFQLSSLFVILSIGTFVMQIPSTWIASKIGNKRAVALGQCLKIIGFLLWFAFPSYWIFALGMFLWGMQVAFFNVSFEGMLYDELAARNKQNYYTKVLGIRYNVQSIGLALAAFGSLLLYIGYNWIVWLSVLTMLLSVLCILRIKNIACNTAKQTQNKEGFLKRFTEGLKVSLKIPYVSSLLLLALFVANATYLNEFISPISLDIGVKPELVGLVQFFLLICYIIGQTFAYKFSKVRPLFIGLGIFTAGACFILFSIFYSVYGLWILGLSYVIFSGINILLYSKFQSALPAKHRAAMLSVYSIGDNIFYIGTCMIIGFGESFGSWRYSIMILGGILVMAGIWSIFFMKREKVKTKTVNEIKSDFKRICVKDNQRNIV